MKTQLITLTATLFLFCTPSFGMKKSGSDFIKKFSEQYNVNPDVDFESNTSFGEVTIESWDNNEISIEVEVVVEAKNEKDANEVFDRIEIKMHGSKERVMIETEMSGGNYNHDGSFEINIIIKAPENTRLNVDHAFGNLDIGTFRNKAKIHSSYGELNIDDMSHKDLDIHMSFGEADINRVGGGEFSVEFGAMEIGHLHDDAELNCSYSSLEVLVDSDACKNLEVDNEFGDVEIEIHEDLSFRVEGEASFGDIDLPSNTKNHKVEKDFSSYSVEATIGQNPQGELVIDSSFGSVTVDFR
ncbi:MAG: DUF4097 family beta strand repeat-containing protein [Flavobacteriales bacterium]|nr:DUF4097 family beta strand repeat-containing protein [Flavobacteriales bacterium]